jgi:hypothetical protein
MEFVAYFFEGAFLCNCVPHLVCGLQGFEFPTPFAKPHGVGLSSPVVNFAWGFFNLVLAFLLFWKWPIQIGVNSPFAVFLVGVALLGAFASLHFGKVRRNRPN